MTNESLLISELRKGSQYAFKGIYDLYAARLYAFGLRYSKSRETTQELVEDTFIWLWNNRERIREVDCLRPILFVRMKHFLVNAYRTTLKSPEFRGYLEYHESITVNAPDQSLEYDDFVLIIRQALRQMPDTQRKVIELSKFEGLSTKEIAESMQLTEQTVRNQLSLGLKLLKKMLGTAYILADWLFFVNYI